MSSTRCRMQHGVCYMKSWYVCPHLLNLPRYCSTQPILYKEQQTVSIAKAGIITTLNARTSVLAAANPVGSKYAVTLHIAHNIDLPPPLISRFDLLYLVLDEVNETIDRKLAQHLVSLYIEDKPETG